MTSQVIINLLKKKLAEDPDNEDLKQKLENAVNPPKQITFSCSKCDYTSNRKFNVQTHELKCGNKQKPGPKPKFKETQEISKANLEDELKFVLVAIKGVERGLQKRPDDVRLQNKQLSLSNRKNEIIKSLNSDSPTIIIKKRFKDYTETCDICGSTYTNSNYSKHCKTKLHQRFLLKDLSL